MNIVRALVAVAVTTTVLSGCQGRAADSPLPSDPPSLALPTPTPTQARETGLVAPAQVFGGDCEALFTSAEISEILGMPMIASEGSYIADGGFPYVEQHAGMHCSWGHSDYQGLVSLIVLPEAAVEYSASTGCDVATELGSGCALEAAHNGMRISGGVFRADNDQAALASAQSSLLELFAQRAEEASVVPVPLPAAGAWAWPVDCVAVGAAGDFSAVPGLGAATESLRAGGGTDAYFAPADKALAGDYPVPYCLLQSGEVFVYFIALGGSRWAEAQVTARPDATTIAVDGIDTVVLSPGWEGTRVDAFDGPNWVTFFVRHSSNAGVLAQALVAALDTTAIN